MSETEIGELKEKNRTLCLPLGSFTIKQVVIKTRSNVSHGNPTDLRLNWPRFWTNMMKEFEGCMAISGCQKRSLNSPNLSHRFAGKWFSINIEISIGIRQKRIHKYFIMMAWLGWSDPGNSWKDRPRLYPAYYCFNYINRQLQNLEFFHRLCENHCWWLQIWKL